MNGQEPDDVRAERADAVEIGDHGAEGPLRRVRADVYGINDLRLQAAVGVVSHMNYLQKRWSCSALRQASMACYFSTQIVY